jgi:hypothetical protein
MNNDYVFKLLKNAKSNCKECKYYKSKFFWLWKKHVDPDYLQGIIIDLDKHMKTKHGYTA